MRNKLVAFVLLFLILISSFITVSANSSKVIILTDPVTDLTYEVSYNNKDLSVHLNGDVLGTTYIHNINAYALYGNTLYMFYADNLNQNIFIYCFDFYNDSINSFAVSEDAFYNENCFSSDGERFYFVSGRDTKSLCIYENGNISKALMKSQIKELLLVENNNLIIITNERTYLYKNAEIIDSSSSLSSPVKYIGGGIIKDSTGKEFYIDNNDIKDVTVETTAISTTNTLTEIPDYIANGFYIADEGVTVSKIKKAFADHEITRFAKANGTIINSGKLGTGATFTLSSGNIITIIIFGEITGEGNINSRDLKAILNHLSKKELLSGDYLIASDVDSDGEVTTKDALKLSQMY